MNEELLQLIYGKMKTDASYDQFKSDIQKDENLQQLAYSKVKTDADFNTFKTDLFGGSTEQVTGPVKKKVPTQQPEPSPSPSQDGGLPSQENTITNLPDQVVDEDIAKLYDQYKKEALVTPDQLASIEDKLAKQKEGDRSFMEAADAFVNGYLQTGVAVPVFKFNTKEELTEAREQKNKVDFLLALPPEKVAELHSYAGEAISKLDSKNMNILAQNKIMEEKGKSLANRLKYAKEAIENLKASGEEVPQAAVQAFRADYEELSQISKTYNKNVDIIESNTEDIDDFYSEINLLKKNFKGLDYYKDLSRLTAADMMGGVGELALTARDFAFESDFIPNPVMPLPFGQEDVDKFRTEVKKQWEYVKPAMSVYDIDGAESFGRWMAEQVAMQLPVITTLVATGGSSVTANLGLGLLSASAAGQKIGELKDEREGALKTKREAERMLVDETLSQEERDKLNRKIKKADKALGVSKAEMLTAGIVYGGLEFATERVSLGILSKGKRAAKALTRSGQKEAKEGVTKYLKGLYDQSKASFGEAGLSEAGAEFINQVGQNLVDITYLDKADVHVFDGAADALASGYGMGVGMRLAPSMVGLGAKAVIPKQKGENIRANIQEINELMEVLKDSDNLDPDVVKGLQSKVDKLTNSVAKDIQSSFDNIEGRDPAQVEELIKLDKKANKIMKQVRSLDKAGLDPKVKSSLLNDFKSEVVKINERKEEILSSEKPKVKSETKESISKEKEQELSEWSSVLNKPLDQIESRLDELDQQEKDVAEGKTEYGPFAEPSEIRQTRVIVKKYQGEVSKEGAKKDFKGSFFGNPGSWLPDALKMRESVRSFTEQGGTFKELLEGIQKEFEADGFTEAEAASVINQKLSNIKSKGLQTQEKTEYGDKDIKELERKRKPDEEVQDVIRREEQRKNREAVGAKSVAIENVHGYSGPDVANKKALDDKPTLRKVLAGVPVLSYLDQQVSTRVARKFEDSVAKVVDQGAKSRSDLARRASKAAIAMFNGLPRTVEEIAKKRMITGKQELIIKLGQDLNQDLRAMVNNSGDALERIHKAMDPDLYSVEDTLFYEDLTQSEKDLYDQLRKINDMTHELNHDLGFIDDETYEKFKGKYIGRAYEPFEDTEVMQRANILTNKIFNKIYQKRGAIDDWKAWNKVMDPVFLTIRRMIQTNRNAAIHHYASSIASKSDNISDKARPGYTLLSGKAYGLLDGKYVVDYIAEDFKGYFFSNSVLDKAYVLAKTYDTIAYRQFLKKLHTVFAPTVQIGNFLSNHAFAMTSGVNVLELWSNLGEANRELKKGGEDYNTLLKNGIIGANLLKEEFTYNSKKERRMDEELGLENEAEKGMFSALTAYIKGDKDSWAKKADEWATKRYSTSDDVMKLAAYKAVRKAGYSEAEAVERVFEGFQNYASVGKIWDLASKTPIFGNPYVKFKADLMRIIKNQVTKRPLTTASFLLGLKYLAYFTSQYMAMEDEDDRLIRESRPFIPKIKLERYTGLPDIPMVWKVSGDEGLFGSGTFRNREINLARFISPYYQYDVPSDHWIESFSESFLPFEMNITNEDQFQVDPQDVLLGSAWAAFAYNKDFRDKYISDPKMNKFRPSFLSDTEKFLNRLNYIATSTVPLWPNVLDVKSIMETDTDRFGRDKDYLDLFISKFVKVQTFDSESVKKTVEAQYNNINYNQKFIKSKISAIRGNYSKEAQELSQRLQGGNISQEKYDKRLKSLEDESLKKINVQMEKLVKEQERLNDLINKYNE